MLSKFGLSALLVGFLLSFLAQSQPLDKNTIYEWTVQDSRWITRIVRPDGTSTTWYEIKPSGELDWSRPVQPSRPVQAVTPAVDYSKALRCTARLNPWLSYSKDNTFKPQADAYTNLLWSVGKSAGKSAQDILDDLSLAAKLNAVPTFEGMAECGVNTQTSAIVESVK